MSDRPMRLKYLTKMKIILCIFLLCITAVSVFGQSVELHGVVGKSIEFPAAVKIDGSLRYSGVPIGDVASSRFTAPHSEKFSGRVQRDSSTGLFSLSGLRLKDSGIYTVQDTQQTSVSTFNLTVWEDNVPVSKPQVSFTHDEYPCTILCAAARGTEVTLSWYREGQKRPYGSYPVRSAPDLYLPQTVHKGGIYTCEAKNSVSNEKASITVGDHCTAPSCTSAGTIAAIIIVVLIVALIAVLLAVLYHRQRKLAVMYENTKSELKGTRSDLEGQRKLAVMYENIKILLQAAGSLNDADDYVDPRTFVDKSQDPYTWAAGSLNDAFRSIIQVKGILQTVDPCSFQLRGPAKGKNEQGREEGDPLNANLSLV